MPSKRTSSDRSQKPKRTPKPTAARPKAAPAKDKPASKGASGPPTKAPPPARTAAPQVSPPASKPPPSPTKSVPVPKSPAASRSADSPANLLARAEAGLAVLLESLNTQMSAAMHALTDLAIAQKGGQGHAAVIRTRPLDRATAMFQRLVAELMDERLAELLPTIVNLRNEMDQRAHAAASQGEDGDFLERGRSMLDQVLASAEVHTYQPRVGEPYDPLIHLAVGETFRDDVADGVVSEVLQPGFRSARGKVVVAARVKVNRR